MKNTLRLFFALLLLCLPAVTFAAAVSVPLGGTGSTTLGGILKGNGTSSVQSARAGTDYQLPIANTDSLSEGSTNKYYTQNRVAGVIAATSTDALSEGSNHLYYTQNRVAGVIAGTSTSALAEGSHLYFTDARAVAALSGLYEVPLTFSTGLSRIGNTITATGGGNSFGYPFLSDATSTLLNFNGGLTSYASSTIGSGGTFGLTVNGSATTTGRLAVGYTGTFTSDSGANFNVAGGNSNTQAVAKFGNSSFAQDTFIAIGSTWLGNHGGNTFALQGTGGYSISFFVNNSTSFATGVAAAILTSGGKFGVGSTTPWGQVSASTTDAVIPALAADQHGTGPVAVFSGGKVTMSSTTCSGFLCVGTTGSTNGTSTIATGKIQFDSYSASGARSCAFIVGTAWVVRAGACNQ